MLVPCPEDDAECEGMVLGAGTQKTLHAHLPVIEGCLYLGSVPVGGKALPARGEVLVSMHKRMNYVPFCADFGPLNLGATCQMCRKLRVLLSNPSLKGSKIVYCTSTVTAPHRRPPHTSMSGPLFARVHLRVCTPIGGSMGALRVCVARLTRARFCVLQKTHDGAAMMTGSRRRGDEKAAMTALR